LFAFNASKQRPEFVDEAEMIVVDIQYPESFAWRLVRFMILWYVIRINHHWGCEFVHGE